MIRQDVHTLLIPSKSDGQAVAVLDRELRIVELDAAFSRLHQLPHADHGGRTLHEVLPQLGALVEPLLRQVIATARALHDVELHALIDEQPVCWLTSFEPVLSRSGLVLGVEYRARPLPALLIGQENRLAPPTDAGPMQPIGEHPLLNALIASAPIGIGLLDHDLRYTQINQHLAEINGVPATAHLGRSVGELLPQLAPTVEPLLRQVLTSGEPLLDLELSGETPAAPGRERVWRASFYPVQGVGGAVGIGLIVTEITEYRQVSVALKAATARTASLQSVTAALASALTLEQVAAVMVEQTVAALSAHSGTLALVNAEGTSLEIVHTLGYTPDLLEPWRQMVLSGNEPLSEAARENRLVLVASPAEAAARYPHLDGLRTQMHDVAWANIPLVNADTVIGVLSLGYSSPQRFSAEDQALLQTLAQQCAQALERARLYNAEQQAYREAEKASRLRDELLALISHDLKNPLTAIQGQTQLLQRRLQSGTAPQERIERGLTLIYGAAVQLGAQVDELLDLARLRVGQALQLAHLPVDMVALVHQTVADVQATTENHRLLIVGDERPLVCRCDAVRVRRVIVNLLSNAVKYSPDGGTISVALQRSDEQGEPGLLLTVSDEGLGIPEADLPYIFEPFHRGANAPASVSGTGLGLASAQQVIRQHGGTITVTSREGQGSCFCVYLPLDASTAAE